MMQVTGRPRIEIDWDKVDSMLRAQCSGMEIADALGIHKDTLYDRTVIDKGMSFSDYSASRQSGGKGLLRHAQFKKAMSGNHPMLIWLGKQYLKQKDTEQDLQIDENTIKQFEAIMNQIKVNQAKDGQESPSESSEDLKSDENSNNIESQS